MTTKIAMAARSMTDQVMEVIYDKSKSALESVMTGSTNVLGSSYFTTTYVATSAIYQISEKCFEAQRQIDRIKSLSSTCADNTADNNCLESISSTVSLISAFLTSPVPIPVAGSGEEGETALFLKDDDFYGDLEISGNTVEYYLKFSSGMSDLEFFDSEEIQDGFIPPKLLTRLFLHYAPK